MTNSQSDLDSEANNKSELDCLIKNYLQEHSTLDKNRLPKLFGSVLNQQRSVKKIISTITEIREKETKYRKELRSIITDIPKEKSINIIEDYILGLNSSNAKFSSRGDLLISSLILISLLATCLNLWTKNLVEGIFLYPYLQVGLSIFYLYIALYTIKSAWELKMLSSNIKGVVSIFENVVSEIKSSIV